MKNSPSKHFGITKSVKRVAEWVLKLSLISLLIISMYINHPTKESQKEGSYSLYRYDREIEIIGVVQKLYRGGHNVPYISVREKQFSIDDTTYSKLKKGDSIYKKANSDFYFIFRENVLIDSTNIREYYIRGEL